MGSDDVRGLTKGEMALAHGLFGRAIDCGAVRVHRRKWFPFQSKRVLMAPDGHIWAAPGSDLWREDYSAAPTGIQGLFLHEMTHVLQAQERGRWYLMLMRHPFCRYRYSFRPDRPFDLYGLEQQAEIVRHVFLLRNGWKLPHLPPLDALEALLPFGSK